MKLETKQPDVLQEAQTQFSFWEYLDAEGLLDRGREEKTRRTIRFLDNWDNWTVDGAHGPPSELVKSLRSPRSSLLRSELRPLGNSISSTFSLLIELKWLNLARSVSESVPSHH